MTGVVPIGAASQVLKVGSVLAGARATGTAPRHTLTLPTYAFTFTPRPTTRLPSGTIGICDAVRRPRLF